MQESNPVSPTPIYDKLAQILGAPLHEVRSGIGASVKDPAGNRARPGHGDSASSSRHGPRHAASLRPPLDLDNHG